MFVIAFLLLGQFFALSHSVDHDSGQGSCVVCRISNPHKQMTMLLATADTLVPARAVEPLFVPLQLDLKPIVCGIELERAPPGSS